MSNLRSHLYKCEVMHRRMLPKMHEFTYGVFMFSVDLDELPTLPGSILPLSHNRFGLFSIYDRDHIYLGKPGGIRPNLTAWLSSVGYEIPEDSRIELITFPRVLGYGFNPVSFYYIRSKSGELLNTVAEVVNTYREMKLYQIGGPGDNQFCHSRISKNFYVSPFSDPGSQFDFKLGLPADKWRVNIDTYENNERTLLSVIRGEAKPLTSARLAWYTLKYPLLSIKIIGLIHWHALLLWYKRIPWFSKSARRDAQLDVLRPHKSLTSSDP